MSHTNDLLKSGDVTLRAQVETIRALRLKVAEFEREREAIATVETLTKAGRLEDSDEPIVKRAQDLIAASNYDSLTKEAGSGNFHIDLEMFGDLDILPPATKEASAGDEIELDIENNPVHRFLYSR